MTTDHDTADQLIAMIKAATVNIERHQQAVETTSVARAQLMRELHELGFTVSDVAKAVGLTRSRVHQIIYPHGKGTT